MKSKSKERFPFNVRSFVQNVVSTARRAWLERVNGNNCRDIDNECGHPLEITPQNYTDAYKRGDVGARVVEVLPHETWIDDPVIYDSDKEEETEFEKAWQIISDRLAPWSYLARADAMSGIGRFGVLLLGFGDGKPLKDPVAGINDKGEGGESIKHELFYLRAFDESMVRIQSLVTDQKNPRYGKPQMYQITFNSTEDTALQSMPADQRTSENLLEVHWTRVIHLADNRLNSEIFGLPRMQRVFNRLLDLKKIAGGSAEMFWQGGFPGLSLEAMPQIAGEEIEIDEEATKEQVLAYTNGLQRYLALVGMQAKSLAPNIADPTPSAMVQLKLIAIAMGVPWRVFAGSEAAQLASEQDMIAFYRRINRRRTGYATPFIIRPFVDRLIAAGVLPKVESYKVEWTDLTAPTSAQQADVADKTTSAMQKYVSAGIDAMMEPFHFLTLVIGMDDDTARKVLEDSEGLLDAEERLAQGDNRNPALNPPEEEEDDELARA